MKGKYHVIGVIILLICLNASGSHVNYQENVKVPAFKGNILYVGGTGPNNYTTIQSAIDDALDGETVYVYDDSSPYIEDISISKSIYLLGENKFTTVIQNDEYFYYQVMTVIGENVVISDFTVKNAIIGIYCKMNNSVVTNLILENTSCGVYLFESSHNTISNNIMTPCFTTCIFMNGFSTNNKIVNNSFPYPSEYGIYLLVSCDKNRIENNLIENKENGVFIEWSYFNVIRKNNFINNTRHAYFDNSSFNFFIRNYWNDWVLKIPRPIDGIRLGYFLENTRDWKTYDLLPAQVPFDM